MIYEIVEAETAKDLQQWVNEKLAVGWELYGGLVTAIKPSTSELRSGIGFSVESKVMLYQAIVKNSPEESK